MNRVLVKGRHALRLAARRLLAVPLVLRLSSAAVRRAPVLRRLVPVLLGAPDSTPRYRLSRVPPGRFFPPGKGETLPIVAFVAMEMKPGDAERLARAIESAQMTTAGFRPIIVADTDELRPFRVRSYVVEPVMPVAKYAALQSHDSHSEYLHERVAAIVRGYGVDAVVPLPPGFSPPVPPHLLRLVGTLTWR